ncbi:unnamed protein product [Cuscuta campestris]|uniref:Uncharacterized protein n=1 Tax=Cuscuta campestris TaxID=132261 RepID=A0A484KN45_9ASTE|nr:unnamed protein product [Cuscuta campestris]
MKKLELVDATVGLSLPTFVERRRAMVGRRLLPSPVASIAAAKAAAHFLVWCDAPFPPLSSNSSQFIARRFLPVEIFPVEALIGRNSWRNVGACLTSALALSSLWKKS